MALLASSLGKNNSAKIGDKNTKAIKSKISKMLPMVVAIISLRFPEVSLMSVFDACIFRVDLYNYAYHKISIIIAQNPS